MKTNKTNTDPKVTSGKNLSYWIDTQIPQVENELDRNMEADVVIVGGGIAGLSVAYCCVLAGKNVVLVEDGFIASGESGRTTAQLCTSLAERYYSLERTFGLEKTKLIAQSHKMAIDFVEQTIKNENIECEFERVNGYLFRHPSDEEDSLEQEFLATKNVGIETRIVEFAPGMIASCKALCFLNQAQFHPVKYLMGLAKAIEKKGGQIFTSTHAAKIDHEGITTSRGFTVKAKHVVVATNSPVNNLFVLFEKQYAYRTYVIGALVEKDSVTKALWWDTGNVNRDAKFPPYHYVRTQEYNQQYDLLICGGEDHPVGNIGKARITEENRYALIEDWAREHFPIEKIVYRWSGQVMIPMDGIAFIGRNPLDRDNVYVVTGDAGNGMTHCSFAGLLICDLILGKENQWEKIYRPSRFTLKKSAPVFKQMMNEFFSYMKQMPNFKSMKVLETIKNGEGRVVDMLEEKFGVYRDDNGLLNIVSAECTHLKCTLAWNSDELSWDCPCHGSRFTYEGKVIHGPANFDLVSYCEVEKKLEKIETISN